jgi:hypothetical protein
MLPFRTIDFKPPKGRSLVKLNAWRGIPYNRLVLFLAFAFPEVDHAT